MIVLWGGVCCFFSSSSLNILFFFFSVERGALGVGRMELLFDFPSL